MIQPIEAPKRTNIAGLVACLTATIVPFGDGWLGGWPWWRLGAYAVLALAYIGIICVPELVWDNVSITYRRPALFLLILAILAFSLQLLSVDPQLQPIVFMIPPVFAVQVYPFRKAVLWALLFWGLMAVFFLGLMVTNPMILVGLFGHTALFSFVFFFGYATVQQARAFQRADALAATLARERDYLQKLVAVSISLPRGMNPSRVLEQVARAGVALTGAAEARVWLDEDETWRLSARAGNSPMEIVPPVSLAPSRVVRLPLEAHAETIGVLELIDVDPAVVSEVKLEPFTAAAAMAITNARLYEQAHVSATLAERNRLARDLHDTIAQGLTALRLQLEAANRAWTNHPERAYQRLQRAQELSQSTLDDVRRSVWDLGSSLVDGHALTEALAQQMAAFGVRTNLRVSYAHTGPPPEFDHGIATQIIRIVGEALTNIEKHAQAGMVKIESASTADAFTLTVTDDGVGFDPDRVAPTRQSGFGLTSLQERARLAGGVLQIASTPSAGTSLTLRLPFQQGVFRDHSDFNR